MTTISTNPSATRRPSGGPETVPARIVVRWEVGAESAVASRGLSGPRVAAILEVEAALHRVKEDSGETAVQSLTAHLILRSIGDGDERIELDMNAEGGARGRAQRVEGCVHLEVPGVLRLVMCDRDAGDGHAPRVAYAWTSVLSKVLGLPGGVYGRPHS